MVSLINGHEEEEEEVCELHFSRQRTQSEGKLLYFVATSAWTKVSEQDGLKRTRRSRLNRDTHWMWMHKIYTIFFFSEHSLSLVWWSHSAFQTREEIGAVLSL